MNSKPHNVVHRDIGVIRPTLEVLAKPIQFVLCRASVTASSPSSQPLLPADEYGVFHRLKRYRAFYGPHSFEDYLQPYQVVIGGRWPCAFVPAVCDVVNQPTRCNLGSIPLTDAFSQELQGGALGSTPILDSLIFFNVLINRILDAVAVEVIALVQVILALFHPRPGQTTGAECFRFSVYNLPALLNAYFSTIALAFSAHALRYRPHPECAKTILEDFGALGVGSIEKNKDAKRKNGALFRERVHSYFGCGADDGLCPQPQQRGLF